MTESNCMSIQFTQKFDFVTRGVIDVTLKTKRESCSNFSFFNSETWIQIVCFTLAVAQMVMTFRYFFKTKQFFEKLNRDYQIKMENIYGPKPDKVPQTNQEKLLVEYERQEEAN